jgi:hypothetical protein
MACKEMWLVKNVALLEGEMNASKADKHPPAHSAGDTAHALLVLQLLRAHP